MYAQPPSYQLAHLNTESSQDRGGRAVVVLIGIQLGMDGINPIYYDTIKVRRFFASQIVSADTSPGPLHVPAS